MRASRGYRWLYAGQVGFQLSRQSLIVAVPYEVFVLTRSSFLVGMVGLVQIAPLLIFSVLGGGAADAFDRTRVGELCGPPPHDARRAGRVGRCRRRHRPTPSPL